MIILIGGTSCTGKTFMAQKLMEKYKIPYFSIDHLKMGLYRSNMDCGFTLLDKDEFIAEKLWPIMKEMIKTNMENNQSIIMEGCYILPKFVKELDKEYPKEIISVYLGFSTEYIEKNFQSSIIKHRNVIETRRYPEDRPLSQFIKEHRKWREKCKVYDANFVEIKNNYVTEIKKAYDFIHCKITEILLY